MSLALPENEKKRLRQQKGNTFEVARKQSMHPPSKKINKENASTNVRDVEHGRRLTYFDTTHAAQGLR